MSLLDHEGAAPRQTVGRFLAGWSGKTPAGREFDVAVPAGVKPGKTFLVMVPNEVLEGGPDDAAPAPPPTPPTNAPCRLSSLSRAHDGAAAPSAAAPASPMLLPAHGGWRPRLRSCPRSKRAGAATSALASQTVSAHLPAFQVCRQSFARASAGAIS